MSPFQCFLSICLNSLHLKTSEACAISRMAGLIIFHANGGERERFYTLLHSRRHDRRVAPPEKDLVKYFNVEIGTHQGSRH